MNNYLGEETYLFMYPSGKYIAGFHDEADAWGNAIILEGKSKLQMLDEGYSVGKCFVFIPEIK